MKLHPRTIERAVIAVLVITVLFVNDWLQRSRIQKLHVELKSEISTATGIASERTISEISEKLKPAAPEAPVSITEHAARTPRATGQQMEVFNLNSSPAFADLSGTRVTGEMYNGTGRHFGLITIALVALDARGRVIQRQPILFSTVAAGDRRAFDTTLNVPLSAFAAHRFEVDTVR